MNTQDEMKIEENYSTNPLIESSAAQRIILAVAEEFGLDINSKDAKNALNARRRQRDRRNAMDLVHHPTSTCMCDVDEDEHTLVWMYEVHERYKTSHCIEDEIPMRQSLSKNFHSPLLKQDSTSPCSIRAPSLRKDTVPIEEIHRSTSSSQIMNFVTLATGKSFLGNAHQEDEHHLSDNDHDHYEFVKRNDQYDLQMRRAVNMGANPLQRLMRVYNGRGKEGEETN